MRLKRDRRGAFRFAPGCCCGTCVVCTGSAPNSFQIDIAGMSAPGLGSDPCADCSYWNDTFIVNRNPALAAALLAATGLVWCLWTYCFDDPCYPGQKARLLLAADDFGFGVFPELNLDDCDCLSRVLATIGFTCNADHRNAGKWTSGIIGPDYVCNQSPTMTIQHSGDFVCLFGATTCTVTAL